MTAQDRPTVVAFRDHALHSFAFLRDQYGFRVSAAAYSRLAPGVIGEAVPIDDVADAHMGDGIVTVRFESSGVAVEVGDDPRLETGCQLFLLAAPDKTRVDLWHIRSFMGAGDEPLFEWGKTSVQQVLESQARALSRYGEPWLRGRLDAWQALLQWWAAGMPATRPRL